MLKGIKSYVKIIENQKKTEDEYHFYSVKCLDKYTKVTHVFI